MAALHAIHMDVNKFVFDKHTRICNELCFMFPVWSLKWNRLFGTRLFPFVYFKASYRLQSITVLVTNESCKLQHALEGL